VEIHYERRNLRLRVRDDGTGIDPKVLNTSGPEGHYGLAGMRECSKLMGGQIAVWSERGSGTEIELVVPGTFAYTPISNKTKEEALSSSGGQADGSP
jgi:signal transduction histidine kinase